MAPTVAVIAAPDKEPVGDAAFSIHLGETDDAGRVVATLAAVLPSEGPTEPERLVAEVHGAARRRCGAARRRDAVLREAPRARALAVRGDAAASAGRPRQLRRAAQPAAAR